MLKSRILNLIGKFTDDVTIKQTAEQVLDQLAAIEEAEVTVHFGYKDGKVAGKCVSTCTIPVVPWIEPMIKALEALSATDEE